MEEKNANVEIELTEELIPADIEKLDKSALFVPNVMDMLIEGITKKAEAHEPDLTTRKGRTAIASNAARVAKSKTFLDKLGKDLVDPLKSKAKLVDIERKKLRDSLDDLKVKVRTPLTEWEQKEDDRQEAIAAKLQEIRQASQGLPIGTTSDRVQQKISELKEIDLASFDEYVPEAEDSISRALVSLNNQLEMVLSAERQKAEFEKLQADIAENKRKAEEEAKENALRESLAQKERERIAAEEQAKQRAILEEQERKMKEEQAKQQAIIDEQARKIREEQEKAQRLIDEKKREEQAAIAAKQAAEQAIIDERKRIAAEDEQKRIADEKRKQDEAHRDKVEKEVHTAVESIVSKEGWTIQALVEAIRDRKIPHVTINY